MSKTFLSIFTLLVLNKAVFNFALKKDYIRACVYIPIYTHMFVYNHKLAFIQMQETVFIQLTQQTFIEYLLGARQ